MEKWEKVLNEFLKEYVDDDSILGAIFRWKLCNW